MEKKEERYSQWLYYIGNKVSRVIKSEMK